MMPSDTEQDVTDSKSFESMKKQRSTNLAQLTKLYNELERKMSSRENAEIVKNLYNKLCDRFEQYKNSHLECLDVCTDEQVMETLEMNFDSSKKNYVEFRERYAEWIKSDKPVDEDCVSRLSSSVSNTSLQYKLKVAKANRLKAEYNLRKMAEKVEIERARRELEMKEQILESRSQLEEAKIEEMVWEEATNETGKSVTNNNPINDGEKSVTDNRKSNDREVQPTNSSRNSEHREHTQENVTVNNEQPPEIKVVNTSSTSDIDSAFQKLASALQEGFNLPKPELLTFDGRPTDYMKFIKNFETNVEKRVTDYQLRLSYLIQYCRGEAKSSIEDCVLLEPKQGYERAKGILHNRYGRSHIIVRSYIDKLVNGSQIKPSDYDSLSKLSLEMQKCEITLSQLGFTSDINNSDNIRKIVRRLPMHMRVKWADIAHGITETGREARFSDLVKFIEQRSCVASSMYGIDLVKDNTMSMKNGSGRSTNVHVGTKDTVSTYALNNAHINTDVNEHKCICCKGTCSQLDICTKFKSMKLADRISLVKRYKLCYNCLKGKHFTKECRKSKGCTVDECNLKHHFLLHDWVKFNNNHTVMQTESTRVPNSNTTVGTTNVDVLCSASCKTTKNCLGIIPVEVRCENGNSLTTYALVDDGADKTLCDERLIKKLNINSRPVTFHMTSATSKVRHEGREIDLRVSAVGSNDKIEVKGIWSVKSLQISTRSAVSNQELSTFAHLSDIRIPEIDQSEVLLLIGTDMPVAHIPLEVRTGTDKDPYAIKTRLGWIVRGPVNVKESRRHANVNFRQTTNDELNRQIERMWNTDFQDTVATEKTCMSQEDKRALDIMDSTVKLEDGHYKLRLPWITNDITMPNNLALAQARLHYLRRKLSTDTELHKMYTTQVSDYIQKGYAQEVIDVNKDSDRIWYIPHHPVTNVNKPGKVRVVFDCAAKFKGMSLNDRLLQGPDLTNSLVGVLIRFRQEQVAMIADIEAMFHQVRVSSEDCDALRFLWWPNGELDREPKCYQMNVHIFGAKSSPSCASYALRKTATDNTNEFNTETVQTVLKNFYVDDMLKSVSTEEKAIELANNLQRLTKMGGFRLTKWLCNSKNVLQSIQQSERAPTVVSLDKDEELPTERALGVKWNIEEDNIIFKVNLNEKPMTRRGIVSIVSSIFDPLGFLSPVILTAKFIMQGLCRNKLGWDDEIPIQKKDEWLQWLATLQDLEKITVPRCFKPDYDISNVQLHIFSDGSEVGYGACAYLRFVDLNGNVNCSFILGKARLAPIKQISIPRLELSGAVLGCRLYEIIRDELEIELDDVVFWTDSTIVLGYINNEKKRFKTFVGNRVSIIHELTTNNQWRHVDSKSNPADVASRGAYAYDRKRIDMWLGGPEFLLQPTSEWPKLDIQSSIADDDVEVKRETTNNATSIQPIKDIFKYFSSWTKLQRAVAWLTRFKDFCRRRYLKHTINLRVGDLMKTEIENAQRDIFRRIQTNVFTNEQEKLMKKKPVNKDSRLASLNPTIYDGLIRTNGRLNLPAEKCPIILPNGDHVTELIIKDTHEENGHVGTCQVVAILRQKFWILKCQNTVRNILKRCVKCKRYQGTPCTQMMAPVLDEQKTPDKPPFTFVGVDYFGPMNIKSGRSVLKRYGCIFTCLTTRAVHLEITHSLTTDSFIAAFKRFTSRRGTPEKIFSDNGTNLVSGEQELRKTLMEWTQSMISKYMTMNGIEWNFNPPYSSHRGGLWERMIRSVRKIFKSLVNEQLLNDEQLLTFMAETERIINDRPITQISDDPKDLAALTPSMLLLMKNNSSCPGLITTKTDIYAKRWWRQVQYLADVFWRRWIKEYLPTLQKREKWTRKTRNIQNDDIVLIADDRVPRGQWPMGRILEVTTGRDGLARSCVVRTKDSIVKRPITKLCVLECN